MDSLNSSVRNRVPWNKGKLTGQKPPLKLSKVWAIRTRLQMSVNIRELAMFNLAIEQAASLRFDPSSCARHLPWKPSSQPGDGVAAKNSATRSV